MIPLMDKHDAGRRSHYQTNQIALDGTAYDLYGSEDAPVVVLIHGLGLCRHIWADYVVGFAKQYRVLNYDLYGHGDSGSPPEMASLTAYAKQILGLLDELHIGQAALVGFSIGGMINRRFALDYPQRLTALVILNSPHDRGLELQQQVEASAVKVHEQGPLATMESALQRWFTPEYREQHPEITQRVVDWRGLMDPKNYTQAAWVLAAGVTELVRSNTPISVPALVLTCENDIGSTPDMSHAIAGEILDSETVIVAHLQHLGLMECTDVFSRPIINFLSRTLL